MIYHLYYIGLNCIISGYDNNKNDNLSANIDMADNLSRMPWQFITQEHIHNSLHIFLQFSLLSEVRGIVTPQDVEKFDGLVLRREIEALKARQGGAGFHDSFSMVSYPDTLASSSASFMTNTTLSSARVRVHKQCVLKYKRGSSLE